MLLVAAAPLLVVFDVVEVEDVAVPVDERPLEAILADDAQPYGWMGIGLQSVMPAHVIYSAVDPNPAGFSRFWLQDMLRAHFNFDGVIFSDDLSMEGASVAGTVTQGARAALDAGVSWFSTSTV